MSAPSARTRLLLLALGVTAIIGLLYWPEAEEPNWAPNPNYVGGGARPTAPPAVPTTASVGVEEQMPLRGRTLSDSEFVRLVAGYGLLRMEREYRSGSDTAGFYFVELRDSTRSLRSLGFIQASALLDSTQRFAALADSAPSTSLAVSSIAAVSSVLRTRMEDCIMEIPVPLRSLASDDRWTLALAPVSAAALPAGEWRAVRGAADHAEALRLARHLPDDSAETEPPGPLELRSLHRFTLDGTDFLVADVRIVHAKRRSGTSPGDQVWEQRLFIGERDARGRSAPFRIVWSRSDAGYPDEMATETPVMMLRLGDDRLLTLNTSGDYKDGGGGLFVSRVAKGQWREVASWYAGC
jgi:hypothetical protein